MRFNRRFGLLLILLVIFGLALKLYSISQSSDGFKIEKLKEFHNVTGSSDTQDTCEYDESCGSPQILFKLHTETLNSQPFACLNDIRLFSPDKVSRGLNIASLDGSTGDILDEITFDVSASDGKLIDWLTKLPQSTIIVAVSFGDVAERVSVDARKAFSVFGATKIFDWSVGSAYSLIGQKGLKEHAYEQVLSLTSPNVNTLRFCTDIPLGIITKAYLYSDSSIIHHRMDETKLSKTERKYPPPALGNPLPNCGMDHPCPKDEIAFYLYSGGGKDTYPAVCVDGHMVFDKDLNGAGRGINVVAVEPKTGRIDFAVNFDTYQNDSTPLEEFLDGIPSGNLVVAISCDEASTMLSDMTKQIFYELGSSLIRSMKFRAQWYFIGHKRIASYTPFEALHIPIGNQWPKPIEERLCIPKSLNKWRGRASESVSIVKNLPRRHFCAKHDKHDEFCDDSVVDAPIVPTRLRNMERAGDPIFNIPILILAGLDTSATRHCLESLLKQEGINTQMVIVAYFEAYPENVDLTSLFHVKALSFSSSLSYEEMTYAAIEQIFSLFSTAPAIAVVNEETVLTKDWLYYFSQTLSTLLNDESIDIVQAFNPFGFSDRAQRNEIVYRVDYQLPLFSYLLSRRFFEREMRNKSSCCNHLLWEIKKCSALVPEVSRIEIHTAVINSDPYISGMLSRQRFLSTDDVVLKDDYKSATINNDEIKKTLTKANPIELNLEECGNIVKNVGNCTKPVAFLYDRPWLPQVYSCFGLPLSGTKYFGLFKGVLRLTIAGCEIFVVPKPSDYADILFDSRV